MIGIYKITNQINGKCYIGQSINILQRWKQHRTNAAVRTEALYLAFQKYGIENFSFEILEECSEEELDQKEQYYISYFNSYKNGYNMTQGGQNNKEFYSSEIFKLWDEGKTIFEISSILGISRSTIYSRLNNYSNYRKEESNKRGGKKSYQTMILNGTLPQHMQPKQICQYDIWGNKIREWPSAHQIERELGIDNSLIGRVIKGEYKQAGGYQWKLIGEKIENIEKQIPLKFGIIKKNLQGEIIKTYLNMKEVETDLKKKPLSVYKCLKHKQEIGYGFKWEYDYNIWDSKFYERGISNGDKR